MTYAKTKGQATARISFALFRYLIAQMIVISLIGGNTYLWWLCVI